MKKSKTQLLSIIPLILFLLLSSYFFLTSYLNFEKSNIYKTILKNNALLNTLQVDIGKESGLTALYLGSNKEEFSNSLTKQRKIVDNDFKFFQNNLIENPFYLPKVMSFIQHLDNNNSLFKEDYNTLIHSKSKLTTLRKRVDITNTDFKEIFFNYYQKEFSKPILNIENMIQNYPLTPEISSLTSSLIQLYLAQEYASLERGYIAYYLISKKPMNINDITLWYSLKHQSNLNDPSYESYPLLDAKIKEIITHDIETFKRAIHSNAVISTSLTTGEYKEHPTNWFTNQTKKITLLTKTQISTSKLLWQKNDNYSKKQLLILLLSFIGFLLSLYFLYTRNRDIKNINKNDKKLETLWNATLKNISKNNHTEFDIDTLNKINLKSKKDNKKAYQIIKEYISSTSNNALDSNLHKNQSLLYANISHEIKTPLNGIIGFSKILGETKLNKEQSEFLAIIDKSSKNLLNILNNILNFSKIENNKIQIENIVFDAQEEFESTIETYAVIASDKNINMNFYMDPTISKKLKGDSTKIKEILNNLLSNAIKFTNPNGEINLEITKKKNDNFKTKIHFLVQDNGIGMTNIEKSTAFNAFEQLKSNVQNKDSGTGLGLTISRRFVEIMGGKLEVDTVKDKGTSFYFDLPLEEVHTNAEENKNIYNNIKIGKYIQDTPSKFDIHLENYFDYYGIEIKYFRTISELYTLNENNLCNRYIIDIDIANHNLKEMTEILNKEKLILLANISNRKNIKIFNLNQNNIYYKPFTLSKLQNILIDIKNTKIQNIDNFINYKNKILLIEDNKINQRIMQHMLEKHKIYVDIAENGKIALDKLLTTHYDMIFIDIRLPLLNGMQVIEKIRDFEKTKNNSHVPIIVVTSQETIDENKVFLSKNVEGYISKPIISDKLNKIITQFLREDNKMKKQKNHKILIAKTFSLEEKILIKVLNNLKLNYTIIDQSLSLEKTLSKGEYDIVFTDSKLITNSLLNMYPDIHFSTKNHSQEEIKKLIEL